MKIKKFFQDFIGIRPAELIAEMNSRNEKLKIISHLEAVLKIYETDNAGLSLIRHIQGNYKRVNDEFIVFQVYQSEHKDLAEDLFKSLKMKLNEPSFMSVHDGVIYGGIGNSMSRGDKTFKYYNFHISTEEYKKVEKNLRKYSVIYEKLLTFCEIEKANQRDDYDLIIRKFEGTFLTILNAFQDSCENHGSIEQEVIDESYELLKLFDKAIEKRESALTEYEEKMKKATKESYLGMLREEKESINKYVFGKFEDVEGDITSSVVNLKKETEEMIK